ncbi:MAG: alpha-amylase family protein [Pseudomonadota bacterium]
MKQAFTALAVLALLAACSGESPPTESPGADPAVPPVSPRTAFVHLFEWSWPAVAAECENVLGPAGYAAVQVSPPQEHHVGPQWYVRYQPVSYQLVSRSGDREQFIDMLQRCKAVGVDIYVDAVINHMTGVRAEGVGTAGTAYGEYEYPPNYSFNDFNHCGRHEGNDIADYNDKWEMQNCELVNLADLDTASEKVRNTLAAYLNELLELGVAGFRIDAAKHMPVEDVSAIMSMVGPEYFVFQEVLTGDSSVVSREAYAEIGPLTEFQYESRVAEAFRHGHTEQLVDLGETVGMLPADDAVVFVDNHDSQRGDHVLTYKDGALYDLANVFMLAHPYGYPKVMSSFAFEERDSAPPAVDPPTEGGCGEAWVCEHRRDGILSMVAFRNAMSGEPLSNWQVHEGKAVSFGRGDAGHVVINAGEDAANLTLSSSLPEGAYCNLLSDDCASKAVVAGDGELRLEIPAMSAVVLQVASE